VERHKRKPFGNIKFIIFVKKIQKFFKECLREIQKYYIKDFQFLRNLSSSCISFFAVDGKTLLKNYDNSYLALDFSRLASYKENILIQFKKKEAAKICFLSLLKGFFFLDKYEN